MTGSTWQNYFWSCFLVTVTQHGGVSEAQPSATSSDVIIGGKKWKPMATNVQGLDLDRVRSAKVERSACTDLERQPRKNGCASESLFFFTFSVHVGFW